LGGRLRQEYHKFKASLCYIVKACFKRKKERFHFHSVGDSHPWSTGLIAFVSVAWQHVMTGSEWQNKLLPSYSSFQKAKTDKRLLSHSLFEGTPPVT
jgi:hypothetical protein